MGFDLMAYTFSHALQSNCARAEVFLSDDAAAHLMFPTLILTPKKITLTSEQVKLIEKLSSQTVRENTLKVYKGNSGEVMFVDKVLGKHDFITYAVGIGPDQKIKQIEILEYRETYGHEVKRLEWRKQFYGKNKMAPFILTQDIRNISGATLSCKHVTDGVRRILQTYELIRAQI